jgi:hypothetical protein
MNIWLHLYRLSPSSRQRRSLLRRALRKHLAKLEKSYGKAVKYSIRSDTLDVHKLLMQNQMISSAIELLNLALSVAPEAKNLRDAKRDMINSYINKLENSSEFDAEDEEFAWNSLYLSSLLQEGSQNS